VRAFDFGVVRHAEPAEQHVVRGPPGQGRSSIERAARKGTPPEVLR
jgi:hypothetical protein